MGERDCGSRPFLGLGHPSICPVNMSFKGKTHQNFKARVHQEGTGSITAPPSGETVGGQEEGCCGSLSPWKHVSPPEAAAGTKHEAGQRRWGRRPGSLQLCPRPEPLQKARAIRLSAPRSHGKGVPCTQAPRRRRQTGGGGAGAEWETDPSARGASDTSTARKSPGVGDNLDGQEQAAAYRNHGAAMSTNAMSPSSQP